MEYTKNVIERRQEKAEIMIRDLKAKLTAFDNRINEINNAKIKIAAELNAYIGEARACKEMLAFIEEESLPSPIDEGDDE